MLYVKSSHGLLEQFLLLVINSFKANKNIFSNTSRTNKCLHIEKSLISEKAFSEQVNLIRSAMLFSISFWETISLGC